MSRVFLTVPEATFRIIAKQRGVALMKMKDICLPCVIGDTFVLVAR